MYSSEHCGWQWPSDNSLAGAARTFAPPTSSSLIDGPGRGWPKCARAIINSSTRPDGRGRLNNQAPPGRLQPTPSALAEHQFCFQLHLQLQRAVWGQIRAAIFAAERVITSRSIDWTARWLHALAFQSRIRIAQLKRVGGARDILAASLAFCLLGLVIVLLSGQICK